MTAPQSTTTAPTPTLSLQIPLILLGRRHIREEWDNGPERYTNRLHIIRDTLRNFCPNLPTLVWTGRPFDVGDAVEKYGRREKTALEKRQDIWTQEEQARWREYETSNAWVLRLTDDAPPPPRNGNGTAKTLSDGDGLLTTAERAHITNDTWTCAITLHRSNIPILQKETLYDELQQITIVLGQMSGYAYPAKGVLFYLVSSERCWPRLGIQRPGSGSTWGRRTVRNVLVLLAAFERELMGVGTPTFLMRFGVVSGFLAGRWGKRRRREEKRVEARRRGKGRMEDGDDVDVGKKVVPERENRQWWEELRQEMDIGRLVAGMMTTKRRLPIDIISLQDGHGAGKQRRTVPPSSSVVDANADLYSDPSPKRPKMGFSQRSEQRLEPFFPGVAELALHVPRLSSGLASAPLIAYVEILAKLFLCAHEFEETSVYLRIRRAKEQGEEGFGTLASAIGVYGGYIDDLVKEEEREVVRGDEVFGPMLGFVDGFFRDERGYMWDLVARYERAGGFVVPGSDSGLAGREVRARGEEGEAGVRNWLGGNV